MQFLFYILLPKVNGNLKNANVVGDAICRGDDLPLGNENLNKYTTPQVLKILLWCFFANVCGDAIF